MKPLATSIENVTTPATNQIENTKSTGRVLQWLRLVSIGLILVSLIMLVRLLPVDRMVALLTAQVEQLGVWGPVLFAGVYIAAAVLFIPGSALTLAAGAVFGLLQGFAVVSVASTSAAALSFLIGRYLARDSVNRWAGQNPKFAAIDRAIGQGGWKIIALLRLSPAVPFSLGNYLFGITSIRFWSYVFTSWLAMMPGTFMYVYLGYAGRAGLSAAAGAGQGKSPAQWALLVVGLLATVAVTVYVTRIARKAIRDNAALVIETPQTSANNTASLTRSALPSTVLMAMVAMLMIGCTGLAYTQRTFIGSLFGPPAVVTGESYATIPDGPNFDHSLLNEVLKTHVDEHGLVNYATLKADSTKLDAYIKSLADAPITQMGRNQRLALLINAYNAFTLRLILDHYPVQSIKDIPAERRWQAVRWNLAGTTYSLDQIEHEQIRPHFREPRVHFALVCAAIGCPPLRNEAYQSDRLEEQFSAQSQYVHTHSRWYMYDASQKVVNLTALYNWFAGDFEQVGGSVLEYVASQVPSFKEILTSGQKPRVVFLDYDWSLNTQN
ncbi:MAG: DUF547 domain-containing protein [Phycisphaerales bacterium]|nr:DUF547 domain-containing protein [Phycisphaerales bacterium]